MMMMISKEKVKKRITGEAYDVNKQTIYIAPKSKIESRAHYAPEPAQGHKSQLVQLVTNFTIEVESKTTKRQAKAKAETKLTLYVIHRHIRNTSPGSNAACWVTLSFR